MSAPNDFLPASLRPRPQAPHPGKRAPIKSWLRAAGVTVVVLGAAFLLSDWRLAAVDVTGCPGLPSSAHLDLEGLVGNWIPALDLESIRQDVERWPGVTGVAVELKLPGTLLVHALPDEICASIRMGRTWRGVTCNGAISLRLVEPIHPILENFDLIETDLRSALSTGSRLSGETLGNLMSIRKITPSDYEVTIGNPLHPEQWSVVRVLPQGTPAEKWWQQAVLNGQAPAWADLRLGHKVVIRRAG